MSSKKFTDLNAGTIGAGSIFAQAQEPALSGDPYTSTKVSATQIANYVAKGQAFTELNNQTIIQAITGGSGAGTVILTMAQYIALTPAQQTDGHIYVISDFACIFCYGRQYRAMKELERAQYDQLSPAEQNNGTLYVLTDEETTAADISYSAGVSVADKLDNVPTFDTLTTSDNNKLLGVSVSGSDISVVAVNPLNGFQIKPYSFNFPNTVGNQVIEVDTGVSEAYLLGCTVDRIVDGVSRFDFIGQYNQTGYCVGFLTSLGSLNVRPYIVDQSGLNSYGGRPAKAIFAVKYS